MVWRWRQFSREYRRMFGVRPSRDARALRDAAVLTSISTSSASRFFYGPHRFSKEKVAKYVDGPYIPEVYNRRL
jgi:hypothetical protein